jgi:hypothetical protein
MAARATGCRGGVPSRASGWETWQARAVCGSDARLGRCGWQTQRGDACHVDALSRMAADFSMWVLVGAWGGRGSRRVNEAKGTDVDAHGPCTEKGAMPAAAARQAFVNASMSELIYVMDGNPSHTARSGLWWPLLVAAHIASQPANAEDLGCGLPGLCRALAGPHCAGHVSYRRIF